MVSMTYYLLGGLALIGLGFCIASCCKKRKSMETVAVVGQQAPTFSLPDQDGITHMLEQYRGKKVVLYFYPKDNTPGCTTQACSLRDGYKDLLDNNIVVLGVSFDSAVSHQKFIQKQHLPFTLLSDTTKEVAAAYGAKGLLTPKRKTYLINEHGVLVRVLDNVDVANPAQEVIKDFK